MDFEDFKEKFVEDVKESLYGRGAEDVNISTTKVDKLTTILRQYLMNFY